MVVIVRQALHDERRDSAADPGDRTEALRQSLNQRVFRRLQLFIRDRLLADDALQLFHELDQRRIGLRRNDRAARAKRARSFSVTEIRTDAVAVAFLLANVRIEPRLKLSAENRVQHLEREVVGRVPRRSGQADVDDRLRGAGFVDEIDPGALKFRQFRIIERRFVACFGPGGEPFLHGSLRLQCRDVADDGDDRAAGLEVRLLKSDDVVARDRFHRCFSRALAVWMRVAVEHSRKHRRIQNLSGAEAI